MRKIERKGRTTGRWPRYRLIVDGTDIGSVKRTIQRGCDRLAGDPVYDGWEIQGVVLGTKEEAERTLIARAVRFGYIE